VHNSGNTTEQWQVTFSDGVDTQTQTSKQMSTPGEGLGNPASLDYMGWMSQTMTFEATSTKETLSFFAMGTPGGQPPVVLLDGVSLAPVPEPANYALLGTALVLVGFAARKWRNRRA
jgi:hypothetical protein